MRITKISVSGLFGQYDHTIPLNLEDHITIIHGPNGVGKTILLRMINGLFQSNYEIFRTIPFREFRVDLDDGRYLVVKHGRVAPRTDAGLVARADGEPDDGFENCITVLGSEDGQQWDSTGSSGTEGENALARAESAKKPPWLSEIQTRFPTAIVDTDRIEIAKEIGGDSDEPKDPTVSETTLNWFQPLVHNEMEEAREAARNTEKDLQMSFRDRFLKRLRVAGQAAPTSSELRKQAAELQALRNRLIDLDLLDREDDTDIPGELAFTDVQRERIGLLLQDKSAKFAKIEPLLLRIELLKRIINDRFLRSSKRLVVRLGEVLSIDTPTGNINPALLSSGEKQYLILFLIFLLGWDSEPGTFFLIDEPELSMHIAWQQKFLRDLGAVARLVDLDFLIATHSPDIIYDRWDLTVELKGNGPDEEEH